MTGAEAFVEAASLVEVAHEAAYFVQGKDARDFLHRMLSQDVRSMAVGDCRPACFLTAEGKVLASLLLYDLGTDFAIGLDERAAGTAIPALDRFVITADVTFVDVTAGWRHLLFAGPSAPHALAALGLAVPEPGRFVPATVAGAAGSLLRLDMGDRPAFRVAVPAARFDDARAALLSLPGVVLASDADLDVLRIETLTPAWGAEIDARVIPNEAGLASAISWTKGCYVGQEAVVMAKHRGHPPTLLCRLEVAGDAVPARDAILLDGVRKAGRVTTAARGAATPGVVALGFVRFDLAKKGTALTVEGLGAAARVAFVAGIGP